MAAEYQIWFTATAATMVTVEADSLDEAIDTAYEHLPYICAQCAGWGATTNTGTDLGDWEVDDKAAQEDYPNG